MRNGGRWLRGESARNRDGRNTRETRYPGQRRVLLSSKVCECSVLNGRIAGPSLNGPGFDFGAVKSNSGSAAVVGCSHSWGVTRS